MGALADSIWDGTLQDTVRFAEEVARLRERTGLTKDEINCGVEDVLAENISQMPQLRNALRDFVETKGCLKVSLKKQPKKDSSALDPKGTYKAYYAFSSPIKSLKSHQVLAINRGEKSTSSLLTSASSHEKPRGCLSVSISVHAEAALLILER